MVPTQSNQPLTPEDLRGESTEELTRQAGRLLKENRLSEAYAVLARLSEREGSSAEIHITAGLVAVQLDNPTEAREHLLMAVDLSPDDFNANYNLALVEVMLNRTAEALARLRHLRRLHPDNSALLNDMAVIWSDNEKPGRALGAFARALRLEPNDSHTRNNAMKFCLEHQLFEPGKRLLIRQQRSEGLTELSQAEINRWSEILNDPAVVSTSKEGAGGQAIPVVQSTARPEIRGQKIAFFASSQNFLTDILMHLADENEVRVFQGQSREQIQELMTWADIAWFEWCDALLIEATRLEKRCLIICRLHSYEAFTNMPAQVNWDRVDHLLFVNDSVREIFRQQVSAPVETSVIHNGLDLTRFTLPEDKPVTKKIASVGYINYKKNPALLLYCFKKIYEYDPDFSLHIAGKHQDPRIRLYFEDFLQKNPLPVYFDGWVDDMPSWYADKTFVISTSLFESFHYSIAEGMASGLLPLIHNWHGADRLYPDEFLFSDPDQCLHLITRLQEADISKVREDNRRFIAERYDVRDKTSQIGALLAKLTPQTETSKTIQGLT